MRRLAAFIMRGPLQAVLVAFAASAVPLLGWFSATVVALVTLRTGLGRGLLVMFATGALLLLSSWLLVGAAQPAVLPLLELWLPTLLLALWLRRSVSLASTLRFGAVLAGLGVLWVYQLHPDQQALWLPLLEGLAAASGQDSELLPVLIARLLPLMTAIMVLSLAVTVVIALLMARWMQALLYHPGGFRREFQELNLGRPMAAFTAALMVAGLVSDYGLVHDLAFVVSSVFALQTLSLGHALVAKRGGSRGWFIGLYALLPLALQLVVAIGIADAAFGWRRRFLAGSGGNNAV